MKTQKKKKESDEHGIEDICRLREFLYYCEETVRNIWTLKMPLVRTQK